MFRITFAGILVCFSAAAAFAQSPSSLDLPFLHNGTAVLSFSAKKTALELSPKFDLGYWTLAPYIQGSIKEGEKETSLFKDEDLSPGVKVGLRVGGDNALTVLKDHADKIDNACSYLRNSTELEEFVERYCDSNGEARICKSKNSTAPPSTAPTPLEHCTAAAQLNDSGCMTFLWAHRRVPDAWKNLCDSELVEELEAELPVAAFSGPATFFRWSLNAVLGYDRGKFAAKDDGEIGSEDIWTGRIGLDLEVGFESWFYLGLSGAYQTKSGADNKSLCRPVTVGDRTTQDCVTASIDPNDNKNTASIALALEFLPSINIGGGLLGLMPYFITDLRTDDKAHTFRVGIPIWFEPASKAGGMFGIRPEWSNPSDEDSYFSVSLFVGLSLGPGQLLE